MEIMNKILEILNKILEIIAIITAIFALVRSGLWKCLMGLFKNVLTWLWNMVQGLFKWLWKTVLKWLWKIVQILFKPKIGIAFLACPHARSQDFQDFKDWRNKISNSTILQSKAMRQIDDCDKDLTDKDILVFNVFNYETCKNNLIQFKYASCENDKPCYIIIAFNIIIHSIKTVKTKVRKVIIVDKEKYMHKYMYGDLKISFFWVFANLL